MQRSLVAYGALCAGLIVGGWMLFPAPGEAEEAVVAPAAVVAVVQQAASDDTQAPAHRLTERAKIDATLVSARPPVPLLRAPRESLLAPLNAASASPETAEVTILRPSPELKPPPEAAAAARAKIEADGYKRVQVIGRDPDGKWRGVAYRGSVEIAVSVDDAGNVSSQ